MPKTLTWTMLTWGPIKLGKQHPIKDKLDQKKDNKHNQYFGEIFNFEAEFFHLWVRAIVDWTDFRFFGVMIFKIWFWNGDIVGLELNIWRGSSSEPWASQNFICCFGFLGLPHLLQYRLDLSEPELTYSNNYVVFILHVFECFGKDFAFHVGRFAEHDADVNIHFALCFALL